MKGMKWRLKYFNENDTIDVTAYKIKALYWVWNRLNLAEYFFELFTVMADRIVLEPIDDGNSVMS